MTKEEKVEVILSRIAFLQDKISTVEKIYEQNPYNNYLLDTKNEFESSVVLLQQELQKVLDETEEPINFDIIKSRVRVIEKDPFLNFKIQNSIVKSSGGLINSEHLPTHSAPSEPPINPVVE